MSSNTSPSWSAKATIPGTESGNLMGEAYTSAPLIAVTASVRLPNGFCFAVRLGRFGELELLEQDCDKVALLKNMVALD
jgi:hypothetical protein